MAKQDFYDAIIVGGGPAGLSAALVLGRCRRSVLICDSGVYRNAASAAVHGFFTRDCTPPRELLQAGREQLAPYGVEIRQVQVQSAVREGESFHLTLAGGEQLRSRKLLLATGVQDELPALQRIEAFYGKTVHHCPYCDAWEHRDQPVAVYGRRRKGVNLAISLLTWTGDVVLLTDGAAGLQPGERNQLDKLAIPVREEKIAALEGAGGQLEKIVFRGGGHLLRSALFFTTGQKQRCDIASGFGCIFNGRGAVKTSLRSETNIPGLYCAGDASHDVQFVIVAASEGAKAAQAINEALQQEDRKNG